MTKVDKATQEKAREYIESIIARNGNKEVPQEIIDKAISDTAKAFKQFQVLSKAMVKAK
jgi:hypothetical protein